MVVDYRKVNAKVIFDSYPMPTVEQAFEQFEGAVVFSILDLNSAYYQIPSLLGADGSLRFAPRSGCMSLISYPWGSVWGARD